MRSTWWISGQEDHHEHRRQDGGTGDPATRSVQHGKRQGQKADGHRGRGRALHDRIVQPQPINRLGPNQAFFVTRCIGSILRPLERKSTRSLGPLVPEMR